MGIQGLGVVEELLQFVQDRIKASEWFQVSGAINAVNDTIEYVPASGKTAVLFEAKIVPSVVPPDFTPSINAQVKESIVADLLINSILKEKTQYGATFMTGNFVDVGIGGGGNFGDGRFNVLGLSLDGDGVKKIEIKNVIDEGTAFATMSGWLFTT